METRSKSHNLIYSPQFPRIMFLTRTGGNSSTAVSQSQPGPGKNPVNFTGPTTCGTLTVTKPIDLVKDAPIIRWNREWDKGRRVLIDIVEQPTNPDGTPNGPPTIWRNCAKSDFDTGDSDSNSADPQMLTIALQPTHRE
jgi:hypothetical protein